jgi:hypothetical protein
MNTDPVVQPQQRRRNGSSPLQETLTVMHTSGRVEDESSRVSSGRVVHSRVEASGVEWFQEQWHNGKRVG